jgi:hypothetical protein
MALHLLKWRRLMPSGLPRGVWVLVALLCLGAFAKAAPLPVWFIGVDEDPLASGYNATDEFSQENFINDLRPGKVTRIPGDPLYNAGNNPDRDDDYYLAGTYPIGFNGLTTNLPGRLRAGADRRRPDQSHPLFPDRPAGEFARASAAEF